MSLRLTAEAATHDPVDVLPDALPAVGQHGFTTGSPSRRAVWLRRSRVRYADELASWVQPLVADHRRAGTKLLRRAARTLWCLKAHGNAERLNALAKWIWNHLRAAIDSYPDEVLALIKNDGARCGPRSQQV